MSGLLWGVLVPGGAQDPNRQVRRCRRRRRKGYRSESFPPPAPSRAHTFVKEGTALAREGEIILYISFQRGAMVASGDRPSPTEAEAETIPLWNPREAETRRK